MTKDEVVKQLLKDNPTIDESSLGEVEKLLQAVREAGVKKNFYGLSSRYRSSTRQAHSKPVQQ